jgi:hypothetical protein
MRRHVDLTAYKTPAAILSVIAKMTYHYQKIASIKLLGGNIAPSFIPMAEQIAPKLRSVTVIDAAELETVDQRQITTNAISILVGGLQADEVTHIEFVDTSPPSLVLSEPRVLRERLQLFNQLLLSGVSSLRTICIVLNRLDPTPVFNALINGTRRLEGIVIHGDHSSFFKPMRLENWLRSIHTKNPGTLKSIDVVGARPGGNCLILDLLRCDPSSLQPVKYYETLCSDKFGVPLSRMRVEGLVLWSALAKQTSAAGGFGISIGNYTDVFEACFPGLQGVEETVEALQSFNFGLDDRSTNFLISVASQWVQHLAENPDRYEQLLKLLDLILEKCCAVEVNRKSQLVTMLHEVLALKEHTGIHLIQSTAAIKALQDEALHVAKLGFRTSFLLSERRSFDLLVSRPSNIILGALKASNVHPYDIILSALPQMAVEGVTPLPISSSSSSCQKILEIWTTEHEIEDFVFQYIIELGSESPSRLAQLKHFLGLKDRHALLHTIGFVGRASILSSLLLSGIADDDFLESILHVTLRQGGSAAAAKHVDGIWETITCAIFPGDNDEPVRFTADQLLKLREILWKVTLNFCTAKKNLSNHIYYLLELFSEVPEYITNYVDRGSPLPYRVAPKDTILRPVLTEMMYS